MTAVIEFLFILMVPLVIVGGAVVTLFAVGALFDALENPAGVSSRIEALFRRPPREPKTPGPGHYYQRFWPSVSSRGALAARPPDPPLAPRE